MDEEVEDLLLSPFNEILEKANIALENAGDDKHPEMAQAAQALVKEAERARKAIEPTVRRNLTSHGAKFVSALKDHDGLAEHIFALTELVYVFDDYTNPDTFDAEKFTELGKMTQQATLRITQILKRMKLENPPMPALPALPPLPPLPPIPTSPVSRPVSIRHNTNLNRRSTTSSAGSMVSRSPRSPPDDMPVMGAQGGPDLGYNGGLPPRAAARATPRQSVVWTALPSPPKQAPPEPPTNPWQVGVRPSVGPIPEGEEAGRKEGGKEDDGPSGTDTANDGGEGGDGGDSEAPVQRRRRASTRADSPTLPSPKEPPEGLPNGLNPSPLPPPAAEASSSLNSYTLEFDFRQLDDEIDIWQDHASEPESPRSLAIRPPVPGRSAARPLSPRRQQQIIPLTIGTAGAQRQSNLSTMTTTTATTATTNRSSVFSITPYLNDLDQMHDMTVEPLSPTTPMTPNTIGRNGVKAISAFAPGSLPSPPPSVARPPIPQRYSQQIPLRIDEHADMEPVKPAVDIDSGLIPVDNARASFANGDVFVAPRPADCTIGPNSSFHLLKGFCAGAREAQTGGLGVRKVQKLSYSGGGNFAAKCTHCFYELQWSEVENDRASDPAANYRMHGIGFRLRFLSKSHLPARQVDQPLYACLFCLQEGHTPEQSDGTVFFNQNQLFKHLARHPRPLPEVPGLTVVDEPERLGEFRDNYDLHFTLPPEKSELDGIRPELAQLPTGTTIENFRKSHGALRRPSDDTWPHQFPAGAKIVGIEFPPKYRGEWGIGWYENVRAPFPAEAVRLDTPHQSEIRTQGASSLRATVRWKWASSSTYRNTEWLRLNQNETISNIVYASPSHWCWAGTNSRGKWGYFPQSHIDPDSLREVAASDGTSVSSREKVGSSVGSVGGGLLSRFRGHGSNGTALRRPVSVSSASTSTSSR